jgi:hypothetical protein
LLQVGGAPAPETHDENLRRRDPHLLDEVERTPDQKLRLSSPGTADDDLGTIAGGDGLGPIAGVDAYFVDFWATRYSHKPNLHLG